MPEQFPCDPIAERFRERGVVPFLGAAASFVGADPADRLPDGSTFATELRQGIAYPGAPHDSLTKVAQFLEEGPADRRHLLRKIERRFSIDLGASYHTSFMDFLQTLPLALLPPLIVTTNYDVLVERSFERRDTQYVAISRITRGNRYAGRWIVYSDLNKALTDDCIVTKGILEERLKADQLAAAAAGSTPPVIVFKIHGTARVNLGETLIDSIVLTESDYIDQLSTDILRTIPAPVQAILRRSSLLFLGYALEDWNFRVLLQRLRQLQSQQDADAPRHWAFLKGPDAVEEQFWKLRRVNMYDLSLDLCLGALTQALTQA